MDRIFVALGLLVASTAIADSETKRVVLADADPELRRAVEASLSPWRIEVVVESAVPLDVAAAQTRADQRAARFVVWRDGDQLVVYDRESGQAERRAVRAGSFDSADAAAAALTVKTMMRLPPLDTIAPEPARGIEIRLEGGAGSRYEQGLDSNVALRFAIAVELRPWRDRGWRFGVLADLGASAGVDQAGFKGTWSNLGGLAIATWAVERGRWELGPWLAIGLEHSSLDGTEMSTARTEQTTLLAIRGGLAAHYHLGAWIVGAIAGIETLPSTETYTKTNSPADVFEIPPVGAIAELVVGIDIAP